MNFLTLSAGGPAVLFAAALLSCLAGLFAPARLAFFYPSAGTAALGWMLWTWVEGGTVQELLCGILLLAFLSLLPVLRKKGGKS